MFTIFFFCCVLVVASSDGAITTKKRDVVAVTDWVHKISKRHSSQLRVRQSNISCDARHFEMSLPSSCNLTALSGGLSDLPASSSLTDAQLTALNNAYSQFCVSACIDPYVNYYNNCVAVNDNHRKYLATYLRHGFCGQQSGDYCPVRYRRQYQGNSSQTPFDSCLIIYSGISCSSASSTCLSDLNTFSDRMGCCTEPFFGSGVNSCSGVSVDEPCTGVSSGASTGVPTATAVPTVVPTVVSSATGLAPVFVMILSLVGFLV